MHVNVPSEVQWLVHEHLPTMEHVDVLLFLARQQGTAQSLSAILVEVSIHADVARQRLADLIESGLVVVEPPDAPPKTAQYRFGGADARIRRAVETLQTVYTMRPVSLIRFVYERPSDVARQFADAFRLRKPKA